MSFLDKTGLTRVLNGLKSVINKQNSNIAKIETSPTLEPHNEGDYIVYKNVLYKVTDDIPANTTLVINTNIEETNVFDELVSADVHHMEITQAEYDALTPEEKNNGTVYFITDGDTNYPTAKHTPYDNSESGLTATNVQDAVDENAANIAMLHNLQDNTLWTNPSPNVSFSAKTLTGFSDLSQYKFFVITFKQSTSATVYRMNLVLCNTTTMCTHMMVLSATHAPYFYERSVLVSNTQIAITDCTQQDGASQATNNGMLIPISILGYK